MRNGARSSLGSNHLSSWLRGCALAGSLAGTLWLTQGSASADRESQQADADLLANDLLVWEKVGGRFRLNNEYFKTACVDRLKALTSAGAPASITFQLQRDIPELKAGKHPWTAARAACKAIVAAVERGKQLDGMANAIVGCRNEMKDPRGPRHHVEFAGAATMYHQLIQAGIATSEPMTLVDGEQGTLQALYEKWCMAGKAQLDAAEDKRAAPFKKLLKNDKLKIALQDTDYIMLPGGGAVTPERLDAANVWFEDASPDRFCSNGLQVHVLHRYQFNAQQILVKTTDREFCGKPPASALR